ncbi:UDP-N-acetylmuramoyl-L-alanyl-D-glutamate--2,6-diaminopimelate ligase [Tindallia californiensis]|uniref:UDP-N-acetylmuramoyl-L-alanyl-D-glutamate--2,6-diaminopimelate ligase n=1 Tax=Tindallia californiensis TaxID=159292 RepID=A0A1H3JRN3_9FIRM|nr:UDP-N-acetylmuramoyl-L-alanyl-D-glutamate--2,6-diaminopimelate ligase [Tindallia californiensis]SDY42028.1 UDP-N-acetylmuramoylalanyl-D-glutamate--2,6-diaminopimelate ligase [Tindallia californiensis]
MRLQDMLFNIEFEILQQSHEEEITHIAYDSRKVVPGSLFICISGMETDGHQFANEAIRKGAIALVVEKAVPKVQGVTMIRVNDSRKAMAVIAAAFYGNPSSELDMIGVTGTNGKTTVTYMLKNIFEQARCKTGVIGTISNWIGEQELESVRTTPESPDFQLLLKKMVQEHVNKCIMEVSSHSLCLQRVYATKFQIGIFTNLTEDHMDFHPTPEHYYQSKKKLFHMTEKANLINIDDSFGWRLTEELTHSEVPFFTYGIERKADLKASNIVMDYRGVCFEVQGMGMNNFISLPIAGKFSVYNALAAIGTARIMEVSPKEIVDALENMGGVPGRFQRIKEIAEFGIIIDYAHTADALMNVLESIKGFSEKRVITVFGCGGDRDKSKRPKMGEVSGKYSDYTIITSDNPRSENPDEILQSIEVGINKVHGSYEKIENRREAIKRAISIAKKGDVILIAGKGHEKTQTVGSKTVSFDDYEVALEAAREENVL